MRNSSRIITKPRSNWGCPARRIRAHRAKNHSRWNRSPSSWSMRRFRERLAVGGYEVVSNTTARNSRTYDGRPACCGNNNCQPICPIAAQYDGGVAAETAEAAGAKIIPNAVVYRIEHDPQGGIAAVPYHDPDKNSSRVIGRVFILAANGIESPKLLLLSASDKYPKGLANSSATVGRNLMDHPR